VPPPLAAVLRILNQHLGDEIDIQGVTHNVGVIGRLHGKGLGLLVKNASKYFK
jgi:hypothetical protein